MKASFSYQMLGLGPYPTRSFFGKAFRAKDSPVTAIAPMEKMLQSDSRRVTLALCPLRPLLTQAHAS